MKALLTGQGRIGNKKQSKTEIKAHTPLLSIKDGHLVATVDQRAVTLAEVPLQGWDFSDHCKTLALGQCCSLNVGFWGRNVNARGIWFGANEYIVGKYGLQLFLESLAALGALALDDASRAALQMFLASAAQLTK